MRIFRQKTIHWAVLATFLGASTGCGQMQTIQTQFKETFASDDPCANNARNIGIAVGAIGGAILGNVIAKDSRTAGTALGALAGGLIGGLVGYDIDRRRCELYKIAKANNLELQMRDLNAVDESGHQTTVGMSAQIAADEQFIVGSPNPTPQAAQVFAQMAQQYRAEESNETASDKNVQAELKARQKKMRILLIGHTDDTGNTQKNADLSEKRARSVAQIFAQQGFDKAQIFYQGAGETLPVADNRTKEGRRQNRRVEIVDLSSDEAFNVYLQSRQPNTAFYRPKSEKNPRSTVEKFQKSPQSSKVAAKMADKTIEKSTAEKTIAAAPSVITPKKAMPTNPAFIDFGGSVQATSIDIGQVKSNERAGFFIRQAEAATSIVDNCIEDSYRQANGVKSLANGATQYKTNDFLPGLYGTSWSDTVNGHLVAITNVAVLRDGGAPVGQPNLLVYKDYQPNKKAQPTFRNQPKVNAYQGQKGVLYRVFVEGKNAPMQCIDLVLNKGAASPQSNLRYIKEGKIYQAPFAPSLAKR